MDNKGTIAPEQFEINGQTYSSEEATRFIELGQKYSKMESDLNTSLDKVYPEFTKVSQRAKELEAQIAERDAKLASYESAQEKAKREAETPADLREIREAARKAGLADQDWLNEQGYVKKSDLEEFFSQKQSTQQLVDNILQKASGLEKDIDGSDGRVPFDANAVLAYASAYQIDDLEEAYNRMNEKGNAKWKEAQLAKSEKPGLTTLQKGGVKTPQEPPMKTADDFKRAWDELFSGQEVE